MKQVQIKTGKVEMLVVDVPSEATEWGISSNGWLTWCNDKYDKENSDIEFEGFKEGLEQIPVGNWKRIGKATELTEEDWKGIVDFFTTDEQFGKEDVFRDYSGKSFFDTATESGLSLLKANGVVLENNEKHPEEIYSKRDDSNFFQKLSMKKWKEAESKVWRNLYLFIKKS